MKPFIHAVAVALVGALPCAAAQTPAAAIPPPNLVRNAYFGELHLHTAFSFDAYLWFGARTTPDEAYRFARGFPVPFENRTVQRRWPLDFMAVTDHSEILGLGYELEDPHSDYSQSAIGKALRRVVDRYPHGGYGAFETSVELPSVLEYEGTAAVSASAWQKTIEAANSHNVPGVFTTFIAYEWSGTPRGRYSLHLHRNVIFKGDTAPLPFSAMDSNRPEDLWSYLETNRQRGIEALAIPHNANLSGGLMFDWNDSNGRPIDQAYAQRRLLNEPLAEIAQTKGLSETHPAISPNDEFAGFELFDPVVSSRSKPSAAGGSYIRDAYGRGLVLAKKTGANPYRFGVVGGSDVHSGLIESDEDTSCCGLFREDTLAKTLARHPPNAAGEAMDYVDTGSAGLTGVWAEQNTRDAIYAALRRKETFATSGTRLKIRFFGGWRYPGNLLRERAAEGWLDKAYAQGTPMGGDLPARPAGAAAPQFLVWAAKDPNGANLDRAQIIKITLHNNTYREKIYDVALSGDRMPDQRTGRSPPVGNTVDLKTAKYTNTIGSVELAVNWRDPEFDARIPAVYYLRVLEIPTPRWSTIQTAQAGLPRPADKPPTIQERAWSSPIWYIPTAR